MLIQDGAKYHTAAATTEFIAAHADRLSVYQLPAYSPDYNPIEHLWKNRKKHTTRNRYFPEFDLVCDSVEEGLTVQIDVVGAETQTTALPHVSAGASALAGMV